MTTTDPIREAMDRRMQDEKSPDEIRELMRGIPIRRIPPKSHNHSVRHKSSQR